ncbi:Polyketide synthase, related [Eimeria necatrix]|uniref:Polyketide synthase, related n=1 Tax=Eimeria necatrix TaxID=51315 RepID=U6MG69_9EIME|nr:Polyketide synthase, related [Eimeria necatrix]CDJ62038.1 Polyketide synthase, related [Eimeria necatrix]
MREFLGPDGHVDVVLNTLVDDYIPESLKLLGPNGRFMELGKRGIWTREQVKEARPDVMYETIAVDTMMEEDPAWFGGMLDRIRESVESGRLSSPPLKVFDMEDPVEGGVAAFRYLQRAQHIGKVVVKLPSSIEPVEDGAIVITGGLGALGLVVAGWLAEEGARNIVLIARRESPPPSGSVPEWDWLSNINCKVSFFSCDVSNYESVRGVFKKIQKTVAPIKGIFHAAGALADSLLDSQSLEGLRRVYSGKVSGAWNIHRVCEEQGIDKDLRFFVLFSSITSLIGNVAQANYASANACHDALAQWRRRKGLCCQSVQWGPWIEQGMAVEMRQQLARNGMKGITNELGFRTLHDVLLHPDCPPVLACQAFKWRAFFIRYVTVPPLFEGVSQEAADLPESSGMTMKHLSTAERKEFIKAQVAAAARQVLGSSSPPSFDKPLQDLGVDSLGAVEFRNLLSKKLGMKLSATTLFDYPTLNAITEYVFEATGEDSGPTESGAGFQLGRGGVPHEGLAIVSVACRFPGSSDSTEAMWHMLINRTDCMMDIPLSRWSVHEMYSDDFDFPGKAYVKRAAFIDNVEYFDNTLFNITPPEVKAMDPQQRILLEVSYESFVSAGYTRESLHNANIGVFVGVCNHDWVYLMSDDKISSFSGTGSAGSIIANRLSYVYGLKGPSVAVDTACSSSLVAVDVAYEKVVRGDCQSALVAGANLMLTPHLFIAFCKARMLSPEGKCKTFDDSANGYARGEGVAAAMIVPFNEAQEAKMEVLAVIRSTACNHVGRSASLIAPNGPSQADVIRAAIARAGIKPADISYVETHGTGTALGDPIEVHALKSVFANGRAKDNPLILGALKTNIGHLEGSSGIAGLIKAVLVLQNKTVPPNIHFKKLNEHINVSDFPVQFPTDAVPLAANGSIKRLFAGVSSFGFGGANAHVILEEVPANLRSIERPVSRQKICFMFTGQGSQYVNMGKALYEENQVFRQCLIKASEIVLGIMGVSIIDILYPSPQKESEAKTLLASSTISQLALFAFEYALAELWMSKNVFPDIVLGHSLGEYVAGCVAGVLKLEDALNLVASRAKIMAELPSMDGVMAAVRATAEQGEKAIADFYGEKQRKSSVAVVNGLKSIVLSGPRKDVQAILEKMNASSRAKFLSVSHAFHSPLVEPTCEPFKKVVEQVQLHSPHIEMISTVTGQLCDEALRQPDYWAEQITKPVRFCDAIQHCVANGATLLVEIGPRPTLTSMGRGCLKEQADSALQWINMVDPEGVKIETIDAVAAAAAKGAKPASVVFNRKYFPWRDICHPLLGRKVAHEDGRVDFVGGMSEEAESLFIDHVVKDQPMLPATSMLELMAVASREVLDKGASATPPCLSQLVFEKPLIFQPGSNTSISVSVDSHCQVRLLSSSETDEGEQQVHAYAQILTSSMEIPDVDSKTILEACPDEVDMASAYAELHKAGLSYGPRFRTVKRAFKGENAVVGLLQAVSPKNFERGFRLHPAVMDGALQLSAILLSDEGQRKAMIPFSIESVTILSASSEKEIWARVSLLSRTPTAATVDAQLFTSDGKVVSDFSGVTFRQIDMEPSAAIPRDLLWHTEWIPSSKLDSQSTTEAESEGVSQLSPLSSDAQRPAQPNAADADATSSHTDEGGPCSTDTCSTAEPARPAIIFIDCTGDHEALRDDFSDSEETTIVWLSKPTAETVANVLPLPDASSPIESDKVIFVLALSTASSPQDILSSVLDVTKVMATQKTAQFYPAWILTSGAQGPTYDCVHPQNAGIWGLVRSIRLEVDATGTSHFIGCADIEEGLDLTRAVNEIIDQHLAYPQETEMLVRSAESGTGLQVLFPRLNRSSLVVRGPLELHLPDRGAVTNLSLRPQAPMQRSSLEPYQCRIRVRAVGLNFRDVLNVMGLYPGDPGQPGADCAGTVVAVGSQVSGLQIGDSVYGIAQGCLKTFVTAPAELLRRMPASCSFEEAAALPVVAATVDYAFAQLADVKESDKVLIHTATGGVGLIAIQYCQRVGATVYATCSGGAKEEYLRSAGIQYITTSRDASTFAKDMQTSADAPASPISVKNTSEADKAYVISGGHGALGLVVCKMLIEEGARHIALLSRSGEPSAELKEGETWQYLLSAQPNIQIKHVKCDISKKEDVRKAFEEIQSGEWPPVRGIFHAAGVTDDKALAEQDKASIEKVYAPKVVGAWNLHEVCEELDLNKDLEIFLMFSSVTAILGNFGQANYAAANACLDAIAAWRRSIGLCGQSIQWGPWVEHGMAAGLKSLLEKAGMRGITEDLGSRVLQDVMRSGDRYGILMCQSFRWRSFLMRKRSVGAMIGYVNKTIAEQFSGHKPTPMPSSFGKVSKTDRRVATIAIVSAACHMPGGSTSTARFWEMLQAGTDCMDEIPLDRWNMFAFYDRDPDHPDTTYAKLGAMVEHAFHFDNSLFNVSNIEAKVMDPQQRILMEVAYDTIWSAGFDKTDLVDQEIGCFVGCCNSDWHMLDIPSGSFTGALVGGVNIMLSPNLFICFAKARMISPDCRCRSFDQRANGYARGEGAGMVFLRPLEEALKDGNPILATLRGSAVNHGGRSASLTAPSGPAQQAAIRACLVQGGIQPHEVTVLEAHGTGTSLGDPIEMGAVRAVYGIGRTAESPLFIGALKTNIGHLEGAAGIAALIKLMLCLRHREIPQNLHFEKLNSYIELDDMPVVFPKSSMGLTGSSKLLGAVSSFGFGGANAHAVLEEYVQLETTAKRREPISWSRKRFAHRETLHPHVARVRETDVGDTVYEGEVRREHFEVMAQHKLQERPVMPGALYLETMAAAVSCKRMKPSGCICPVETDHSKTVILEEIEFQRPMLLEKPVTDGLHDTQRLFVTVSPGGQVTLSSSKGEEDETFVHVTCRHIKDAHQEKETPSSAELLSIFEQDKNRQVVDVEQMYQRIKDNGLVLGPKFRVVKHMECGPSSAKLRLELPGPITVGETGYRFHPCVLDGTFQTVGALVLSHDLAAAKKESLQPRPSRLMIPFMIQRVAMGSMNGVHKALLAHVALVKRDASQAVMDINIMTEDGDWVASITHLTMRAVDPVPAAEIPRELLWHSQWQKFKTLPSIPEDANLKIVVIDFRAVKDDTLAQIDELVKPWSCTLMSNPTAEDLTPLVVTGTDDSAQEMTVIVVAATTTAANDTSVVAGLTVVCKAAHRAIMADKTAVLRPIWIVTHGLFATEGQRGGCSQAGAWGFARAVRLETAAQLGRLIPLGCVDVEDPKLLPQTLYALATIQETKPYEPELLACTQLAGGMDDDEPPASSGTETAQELQPETPSIFVHRLAKWKKGVRGPVELHLPDRGAIASLVLRAQSVGHRKQPKGNMVEVRVRAIGLNFRDVLNVMGLYPGDPGPPGSDCAGMVVAVGPEVKRLKLGDTVFGIVPGCLRTFAVTSEDLLWKLPDGLSFSEGATLPVVATTVQHALGDIARVKAGDKVLIHAVSGGVGLLAIQHCKRVGAIVYGTCGSEAKTKYVKELGVQYVTSSRKPEIFVKDMRKFLGENGKVDVVLNSLLEPFISSSLSFLAENGIFIELGKRGIWTHEQMKAARPDVQYETVAVDLMIEDNPRWFALQLHRMTQRLESGALSPLPATVFDMTDQQDGGVAAFRFLQKAQHVGKVVLAIPSALSPKVHAATLAKSYIVTGGHGALGLVVCKMLIEEGARHIALLSRSGEPSAELKEGETWQYLLSAQPNIQIKHVKWERLV